MNFFSLFKRRFLYRIKKKFNIDSDNINNNSLDKLFHHYGSDKANIFKKEQRNGHGFSQFYEQHFEHLKDKEIKILEIGSFSGASAAAFAKYFTKSEIYCFDINISNFIYSSKKIKVFCLDINNKKSLKNIFEILKIKESQKFFDIIIDDGSHYLSDILFSFKTFFQYIKKNGIYVIEDYKYPNYHNYNMNVHDILVDKMLAHLNEKKNFESNIIKESDQNYLIKNIKNIKTHKGQLQDSDICFIKKN